MSEGINQVLQAAIESQTKNRAKSQRRKERAEKRKIEVGNTEEPPSKKQKKTNSSIIPLTAEHRKFLGEFFHCTPFYSAPTNSVGVFTGFDLTPCLYYTYPCVLGETTDRSGNKIKKKKAKKGDTFTKATDYVLACGNPVNIFIGLQQAFKILFPDLDPGRYRKWEAWRLNNEYYTSKVSGQASDFKTFVAELGESKVMGGARPHKVVHVIEDIGVSRNLRAISLEDHFAKVSFCNGLQTPIPSTASVNSMKFLNTIRDMTLQMKEDEKKADAEATVLVKSKSFTEKMNQEDESSEEYSSE